MINKLIELSLRNRFLVVAAFLSLGVWGWWALRATPIDAIPGSLRQPGHRLHGLVRPQPAGSRGPGHLPADGEPAGAGRRARGPVAVGVRLLDDLRRSSRTTSTCTSRAARVLERMSLVTKSLPEGVTPTLGPDATGVGHVFWYTVESPTHSLRDLRTPAGLVHPLPAECRARRGGSRVGRRARPAVPDRRRSEPAPAVQRCRSARSSPPSATATSTSAATSSSRTAPG